jgi:hypothetical protein
MSKRSLGEISMSNNTLATHKFTGNGPKITLVGLGGEGILRTHMKIIQAREVIQTAVKQGITYFYPANLRAIESSSPAVSIFAGWSQP